MTVESSSLGRIVILPLITVHCLLPTVTVEAVWMDLETSPVSAIQVSQAISVMLTSMNAYQLDARMDNVKT